jgi:hypothetical protein
MIIAIATLLNVTGLIRIRKNCASSLYKQLRAKTKSSLMARVNSFEAVKSADVYTLTKWQYYDDWIIREIDKRLLPRPLSRKSIRVADKLYSTHHRP